jgi:hypothetical protein
MHGERLGGRVGTTFGDAQPCMGELVNDHRPPVLTPCCAERSCARSVLARGQSSGTGELPERQSGEHQHR